jgi:hypothetical protein
MSELVENHQEDKMAAIDSLREEYEEHCATAVQEVKRFVYFLVYIITTWAKWPPSTVLVRSTRNTAPQLLRRLRGLFISWFT